MVSGKDRRLSDALAVMAAWAADAEEQSFLQRHVRSLIADLDVAQREAALIDLITGLIILNGGLLKLQADRTGVTLADVISGLQERTE